MKKTFLLKTMLLLCALVVGGNAWATDVTVSWTASSSSLGSAISAVNGTATGYISTGSFRWDYTRTLLWLASNKSDFIQMNNGYMQCGSGNAKESLVFTTSNIPGIIKSVAVDCWSKDGKHNLSITVGGTSYFNGATPSSSGNTKTGTGSSSGNIEISFSLSSPSSQGGALYIKSITVTYTNDPFITVYPTSSSVNYDTEGGTLAVTSNRIDTDGIDIQFYEEDGTTVADDDYYNWFAAEIDANGNVSYILFENTDPDNARTAYFKVFGIDDNGDDFVYSDLISITQSKYTVDYATLPFSYDGGKGNLPTGLTHTGLGNDYTDSPKLRFDDQGDNLILKVKGALLNQLEFDIKGNSLSGSYAFTVQWSANGTTWTDLASYTSLPSSKEAKTINISNCTNLKYIKWVYTTKASGNVALGNIIVTPQTETATVTNAGWATWKAPSAVSFREGTNAYIVSGASTTSATLQQVTSVPANTPILLQGEGTHTMNKIASSATVVTGNCLHVSDGSVVSGDVYVLAKPNDDAQGSYPVGFYKWDGGTLASGQIYLQLSDPTRTFIALPGEETGINNVSLEATTNNRYFDLQGRRVMQPTKGLYIVNGKKVIIK